MKSKYNKVNIIIVTLFIIGIIFTYYITRYNIIRYNIKETFINNFPVYCFWTGNNEMSETRKKCLNTIKNTNLNVILITPDNLNEYINEPLHEGYKYLSEVHKADYLRTYFMHFYGGGYTDVKETTEDWLDSVEKLYSDNSKCKY